MKATPWSLIIVLAEDDDDEKFEFKVEKNILTALTSPHSHSILSFALIPSIRRNFECLLSLLLIFLYVIVFQLRLAFFL
jgi:hypothetical protein